MRLPAAGERRPPFAVAAVEHQHPVAGLEAQHVAEIMRLRFAERDLRAGLERVLDMETGAAKIVAGQSGRALYERRPALRLPAGRRQGPGQAQGLAVRRSCRPIARIEGLIWRAHSERGLGMETQEDDATSLASRVWTLACACVLVAGRPCPAAPAQFLPAGQANPPPPAAPVSAASGQVEPVPAAAARPGRAPAAAARPSRRRFRRAGRRQRSVCETFLRDPPARRRRAAAAIQAAGERKASREEVCPLFKTLRGDGSQDDQVPGQTNQTACGVPPQAINAGQGQPRQDDADPQQRLQRRPAGARRPDA